MRQRPAGLVAAFVQAHAAGTTLPPYGSIADPREDAPDILPGISIEKITALADLYAQDAEFVPPTLGSDRALRDMLIKEINDRRVELQWAADAAGRAKLEVLSCATSTIAGHGGLGAPHRHVHLRRRERVEAGSWMKSSAARVR